MSKFIIENALIEASEKNIKTGLNYEFSDGLNIICGDNETGKSSLMTFLCKWFYKDNDSDTGRINFKITDGDKTERYRAVVRGNTDVKNRCKITDENNNSVDNAFIEKTINRKYFEQGFTIKLDNLMSIKNKDNSTLKDTIKDPSSEQLSIIIDKMEEKAKDIIGERGKQVKETLKIINNINDINFKINKLRNMEEDYNEAVDNIKAKDKEIEDIIHKEKFINFLSEEKDLKKNLLETEEKIKKLKLEFNENLIKNRENYISIIQNSGKYESNNEIYNNLKTKLDSIKSKINININHLNKEYNINNTKEEINGYNLNASTLYQIKQIINDIEKLKSDLLSYTSDKKFAEESLLKLKHENIALLEKYNGDEQLEKLEKLNNIIKEGINQYKFLSEKINYENKSKQTNPNEIKLKKTLLYIFSVLFVFALVIAIVCFINKYIFVGVFSSVMFLIILFGFIYINPIVGMNTDNREKSKDEILRTNILNEMLNALKDYSFENLNDDDTYISLKIENIRNEIQNKIQNILNTKNLITKNQTEINCNKEKLDNISAKEDEIYKKINELKEQAAYLIKSEYCELEIPFDIFPEVYNFIKELKENIMEENSIHAEITETENKIKQIEADLKNFIVQNDIKISVSEKFEDNISKLKEYNDKNDDVKSRLDILYKLESDYKQKEEILAVEKEKYNQFNEEEYLNENKQAEINQEKERIYKEKKEAEFRKKQLEIFEGLGSLKIERNHSLEQYKKNIKEFLKSKILVSLMKKARHNFAKVQPDLQNAQKYLSLLTDEKYSIIDLDREEILDKSGGNPKNWKNLSRGTKEQLYLALRLGYASNYAKDKVTLESNGRSDLPVIIDDAFVNFDKNRTINALKCMYEFSKTNQVLFFTCHTDLINDYINAFDENENKNIKIINM